MAANRDHAKNGSRFLSDSLSSTIVYGALALFIIGHWLIFFKFGNMNFKYGDWPKEQVFYSLLKEWVSGVSLPLHFEPALQETNRFFGLPETVLSPQTLLIRFMSIGQFVMVNTIIMSFVGLWGLIKLRREYKIDLTSFTMLAILFEFSGYIVAHLGQGHSMWNGYYVLPFYVLYIRRLVEKPDQQPLRQSILLSFSILGISMQGTIHMFVWTYIFLALVALCHKPIRKWAVVTIGLSTLLCMFRLAPAALALHKRTATFYSGYPSVTTFMDALIRMEDSGFQARPGFLGKVLGWWEYDFYLGILGAAFIATFAGIYYFRSKIRHPLFLPLGIFAALSFNSYYQIITLIPVPLANSERVSARFMVIVFAFLVVFATEECSKYLREHRISTNLRLLLYFAIAQTAVELAAHSRLWSLVRLEKDLTNDLINFHVVQVGDSVYIWFLCVSWTISLIALATGFVCLKPNINSKIAQFYGKLTQKIPLL
jgi:hypothetical protein